MFLTIIKPPRAGVFLTIIKHPRAGVFLTMGLSAVIPGVHYAVLYGWQIALQRASLGWMILMGCIYVTGRLTQLVSASCTPAWRYNFFLDRVPGLIICSHGFIFPTDALLLNLSLSSLPMPSLSLFIFPTNALPVLLYLPYQCPPCLSLSSLPMPSLSLFIFPTNALPVSLYLPYQCPPCLSLSALPMPSLSLFIFPTNALPVSLYLPYQCPPCLSLSSLPMPSLSFFIFPTNALLQVR